MAKGYNSVLGIDLGQSSVKTVHLQRKGSKIALTGYAIRPFGNPDALSSVEALAAEFKEVIKATGGSPKAFAIASSARDSIVKIVEQPITPTNLLRDAIRLHSASILNQDCKEWIIDCDILKMPEKIEGRPMPRQAAYLVAGMKRAAVNLVQEAAVKAKMRPEVLQLSPISTFNAFEVANEEVFGTTAFMILDIGHLETTVIVGSKKELVLIRHIDFGGKTFVDALTQGGAIDTESAILLIEQGDPGMADVGRGALTVLAREVRNSIGFVEGQREESIGKVYVCGAIARAEIPLQVLSNELDLPCELWDPFARCENSLPKSRRPKLEVDYVSLNAAFGAAWELLHREA